MTDPEKMISPPAEEPSRQFYYMDRCREIIRKRSEEAGRPLKAFIQTFGCQMNERDSILNHTCIRAFPHADSSMEYAQKCCRTAL